MKKIIHKPIRLSILLLTIYLIGSVVGSFTVIAIPAYREQKRFTLPVAREIAAEYCIGSANTLEYMNGSDFRILVYDTEKALVHHQIPNHASPDPNPGTLHEKYISFVFSGKEIFRLTAVRDKNYNKTDIVVVAGVPIQENGGAVFMIKALKNLIDALQGFLLFFTILYWLSAALIVYTVHKKQTLDALQRTYIANVTHALKTPVASIKALSETLCDEVEPDPDKQKVYYGMILREANRQDHMIRDVLELSKLQSNGMDFTKTKLHATEVFDPVLDKYATLCDCMDITLHISETLDALPPLHTNAACVRQTLEILLDNALKFVSEGGNIWVDVSVSGKTAAFCVRDDGIGIEKDALPQVFDRFFKGSHDFNSSGSGLGLAIAREITAGLKERIWVESQPGKGAAFFFSVHLK